MYTKSDSSLKHSKLIFLNPGHGQELFWSYFSKSNFLTLGAQRRLTHPIFIEFNMTLFFALGDKDGAIEAIRKTMEKTVGLGNKMDLIFHNIRIGLFWMDHALVKANLDKATT